MKNEEIEESSSEQTGSEPEDVMEEGTEDARTEQDLIEELRGGRYHPVDLRKKTD